MAVVKYDRNGRPSPYGVKWTTDGQRKFRFFKNRSVRDDFYAALLRQEKKIGNSLLALTSEEAVTIKQCVDLLGSAHEVIAACREYAAKTRLVPKKFEPAYQEYLLEKTTLGRCENYYRSNLNIFRRAALDLPETLKDWTAAAAHEWALSLVRGFSAVTVRNHVKDLRAFCNWCVTKKYLHDNPFAAAPVPEIVEKEIEFLKVGDVQSLFVMAMEKNPQAVAYLALNTFAGIRSSACARLDSTAIDFRQRGIHIAASIAKNKRRVYLDGYEPNLWKWLEWARKNAPEGFNLTKRQWDKARSDIAEAAGVKMPHNALRHTFCTYHVALYGDAGKTATLLTHRGNVSVLYEHYKGNATRAEAVRFFGIGPGTRTDTDNKPNWRSAPGKKLA